MCACVQWEGIGSAMFASGLRAGIIDAHMLRYQFEQLGIADRIEGAAVLIILLLFEMTFSCHR